MKSTASLLAILSLLLGLATVSSHADDRRDLTKALEKRAEHLQNVFHDYRRDNRGDRYLDRLDGIIQGYTKAAGDLDETVKDEKGRKKFREKLEKVMEYVQVIDGRIQQVRSRDVLQAWRANAVLLQQLGVGISNRSPYGYDDGDRYRERPYNRERW